MKEETRIVWWVTFKLSEKSDSEGMIDFDTPEEAEAYYNKVIETKAYPVVGLSVETITTKRLKEKVIYA